jgi:cytochrome P450
MIRSWDIVGLLNMSEVISEVSSHRHLDASTRRFDRYQTNTYATWIKGCKTIFTRDDHVVRAVFSTNVADFRLGTRRRDAFHKLLGHGIFVAEGAAWSISRRQLRPSFAKESKGVTEVLDTHVQNFIGAIRRQQGNYGYCELRSLFHSFTLDVFTEVFLGESCQSLREDGSQEGRDFQQAYDACMHRVVKEFIIYPLDKLLPKGKYRRDMATMNAFVDRHVTRVLAARRAQKPAMERSESRQVVLEELANITQDPQILRNEMLNLLFAGRDSTASLLTNMFHFLARQPQAWSTLRKEVLAQDCESPDSAKLKTMPYLQACLQECKSQY